jgi:NAD(P)-dependent dehydrogenase (short-subunit alcohol dehydrogenase family)
VSEGKLALVTGAGKGIGAACCRALADAGFRVAVHYRSSAGPAEELAAKLPDAFALRADPRCPSRSTPSWRSSRSAPGASTCS